MPKSEEERITEAVEALVQAVDVMFQGDGLRIIVGLQASDEYPFQVELRSETLPYAGLARAEGEPATREASITSVADGPSKASKHG